MDRPRVLSTLLVVVLVAGLIYLGTDYLRARQQKAELAARLDDRARTLALIPVPPSNLLQQLADAKQASSAARGIWPDRIDTTQIIKRLLAAADAAGVKAIPLTTDEWSTKTIGDSNYRVLSIEVSVEGSLSSLTAFLGRLYGSEFAALGIETVTLTLNEARAPVSGSAGSSVYGKINLAIFGQPPDLTVGQR